MENRVNDLDRRLSRLEAKADERAEVQADMQEKLDQLIRKIDRWEGKFGGIIFIGACLWAFFTKIPELFHSLKP